MLTVEKDGGVEGCALTCENTKSQVAAEQPSKGGSWNPPKKDAPCPRTKGRRGAITFKIKPPTCQTRGGHKESAVCTRTRERSGDGHKRLGQACESQGLPSGSAVACRGGGALMAAALGGGMVWGRSPLGGRRRDDPQTGDRLYQRRSRTTVQVLGPTRLPNLGTWRKEWESPGNLALQFSWI